MDKFKLAALEPKWPELPDVSNNIFYFPTDREFVDKILESMVINYFLTASDV